MQDADGRELSKKIKVIIFISRELPLTRAMQRTVLRTPMVRFFKSKRKIINSVSRIGSNSAYR